MPAPLENVAEANLTSRGLMVSGRKAGNGLLNVWDDAGNLTTLLLVVAPNASEERESFAQPLSADVKLAVPVETTGVYGPEGKKLVKARVKDDDRRVQVIVDGQGRLLVRSDEQLEAEVLANDEGGGLHRVHVTITPRPKGR